MNCIVNPPLRNPVIDVRVISEIQTQLATLGWIEEIFALADKGERKTKGTDNVIYPRVYKQSTQKCDDYIDLFPNDQLTSFCFFERRGNIQFDRIEEELEYNLSIVFWANLRKLNPNMTYDFTDELAVDVLNLLDGISVNLSHSELGEDISLVMDRTQVWDQYTYTYEDYKYHQVPYTTFRVDFTVKDFNPMSCQDDGFSNSVSF